MLSAICQCQVAQVGKVLEEQTDLEVLQLCDDKAEDLVARGVKLFNDLSSIARRPKVLQ